MLHQHPEMSLENAWLVKTLLILQQSFGDCPLELVNSVSGWMFSVPGLLHKVLLFHLRARICNFHHFFCDITSFALAQCQAKKTGKLGGKVAKMQPSTRERRRKNSADFHIHGG